MKTRNVENKLALVAALIVLIGVLMAASSAFSADLVTADRAEQNDVVETISGARKANAEAAADAAKALKTENELDLDIQLAVLTSTLIADAK